MSLSRNGRQRKAAALGILVASELARLSSQLRNLGAIGPVEGTSHAADTLAVITVRVAQHLSTAILVPDLILTALLDIVLHLDAGEHSVHHCICAADEIVAITVIKTVVLEELVQRVCSPISLALCVEVSSFCVLAGY